MLWCGDFNRHHPLWDRDEDTHLFTSESLNKAERLIELLADHGMEMILPKGIPTLQHMRSKRYSRPDNVFCSDLLAHTVIRCEVDARARPTKTDHFPIITILELPQDRVKQKPTYDFRMADWEDILENLSIRLAEIPDPTPLLDDLSFQQAVDNLTGVLQDTIRTRVKLKQPVPQSRRWWNSDLEKSRKKLNKLSGDSYRFRALDNHSSHRDLRRTRNQYGEAIMLAKRKHWTDYLEGATASDIWTANRYVNTPAGDGGNPRIPTLKVTDPEGNITEVNTNDGKAKAFAESFFPDPPLTSSVPPDFEYPDPLPDPPPITRKQIEAQIHRLSPYKACGPDEIPNIMLQKSFDLIADHLLYIFQAIFSLRTYYKPWKESITVVLRKPGKPSYEVPKAYRPIALLCTMAKVLTAIVAEDISRLVEKHQLVPTTHFGGRPGRTTTDALHYLVHKIKEAWRNNRVASILFIDVEGAFPNAVTDRLIHNLRKRKIPKAYTDFVRLLLEERKTRLKFDDFISVLIAIRNGIGQGDPLSMILYILYNADLLEILALLSKEDSIGYVDDAIAIAFGKDFYETTRMLAHMMNREDGGYAWSVSHNSRYEISKLAVLHASQRTQPDPANPRKRIPLDRPPLQLQGKTVKEVDSFKYLGVHVNAQLWWTIQAQKGVASATKWIMQLRWLTKISTGINAKLLRQLYISVAIPKMTYALDLWYTPPTKPIGSQRNVGSVGVLRQMQKLQRLATLSIVGGMRSTPTDLLDAHAGLLPMELTLLKICHRAMVRLCTLPSSHPLHSIIRNAHLTPPNRHRGPINNGLKIFELNPHNFETITPDTTAPTYTPSFKISIPETREDSIKAEQEDPSIYKIFTDGSGHNGKVGASAVLYKKGETQEHKSLKFHLGMLTEHTTYEAEAVGAILATWLLRSLPSSTLSPTNLYTDSQAFIRSTIRRATGSGHYLIKAFCLAADSLQGHLQINWISSHSEVTGNEKADELAKQAALGQSSPPQELPPILRQPLPLSTTAEKQAYVKELDSMWQEQWQDSPRRPRMELIDKSFPFNKFRKMQNDLTRAQSSLLLQLRSGHIPLNAHLFKLNCSDTDKCLACITRRGVTPAKETVTHFLFNCPAYRYERHELDRALGRLNRNLEAILDNRKLTQELLRYIGRTKRLKRTFGNLAQSIAEDN